jgi:hypothetical protein
VLARQLYAPYGTVRYSTGSLPTDIGFTGQRLDDAGLMYYGARIFCLASSSTSLWTNVCARKACHSQIVATSNSAMCRSLGNCAPRQTS